MKMAESEEIQELFKSEENRNFKKNVSGFLISQLTYNGNLPEDEI